MNRTITLFNERKEEIEFFYATLKNSTSSNYSARFERMLKSNFLLMLYNLIEACITGGFLEIYESIENDRNTYRQVIPEFQRIWSDSQVSRPAENTANQDTYKSVVRNILSEVLSDKPLDFKTMVQKEFVKRFLRKSGNFDAMAIRELLKNHNIHFNDLTDKHKIFMVKEKRNHLAHGEESFENSAHDFTVTDLESYKNEVLDFVSAVLDAMNEYYTHKRYLAVTR